MVKFFLLNKSKIRKFGVIPLFFVVLFLVFFTFKGSANLAFGDENNNVNGWAWSSNIGWIKLNCDTNCAPSDFGVKIEKEGDYALNLSGDAWSPRVGWISFNETGAPNYSFNSHCSNTCNSSNQCTACLNPDDGKIYGWAKILSMGDKGWIKMEGNVSPSASRLGDRRTELTIDKTKLTADVSGFPVSLVWTGNQATSNLPQEMFDADGGNAAQFDGRDVRFTTDSAGLNQVPFEIVSFGTSNDPANARAEIWVKLPLISSLANTSFYVWYKNSSAIAYAPTDTYGRNNVWTNGYAGVWHLPNGLALTANDSLGVNNGTLIGSPLPTAGQIDGGASFSGSNYINVANFDNFDFLNWTYSVWFKSTQAPFPSILGRQFADATGWTLHFTSGGKFDVRIDTAGHSNQLPTMNVVTNDGSWHLGTVALNDATKKVSVYVDGINKVNNTGYIGSFTPNGGFLKIAGASTGASNFNGAVDQIEISSVIRSADWITAEYNNQKNPQTFVTVGSSISTNLSSSYGVYIDQSNVNGEIKGWAWNGNADSSGIGWISFNCANQTSCGTVPYIAQLTSPRFPMVYSTSAPNWSPAMACSFGDNGAKRAFLKWTISGGSDQHCFEVKVGTSNNINSAFLDTNKTCAALKSTSPDYYLLTSNSLNYNTPYYWWVRVWNGFGFASAWKQFDTTASGTLTDDTTENSTSPNPTLTFTTYKHEFPIVQDVGGITRTPLKPNTTDNITYTSNVNYYTSGAPSTPVPCTSEACIWLWTPSAPSSGREYVVVPPASLNASSTIINFPYGNSTMSLTVTGPDNYSCTSSPTPVFVDLLPVWREVKPQ